MDTPTPDPAIDALRRDVLDGLVALEARLRRHIDESTAETGRYIDASTTETRRYIDASTTETHRYIDASTTETRRYIDESTTETRRYIDESTTETHRYIDERTVDTRRQFGVVAESLMAKIELVGEGVRGNNERLDRFQVEVREQFARVDRRLLRLEARLPRARRR